jgi:hypothetical protein
MPKGTIRFILTLFSLAIVSATIALAQSSTSIIEVSAAPANSTWQVAPSKGKILVVTLDQPNRRQACRIPAFTPDKLVCSRTIGGRRTYLRQQVVALILPGDNVLRRWLVLGFNGMSGGAIWGTVVLAATCPACAVATGIAALWFLAAAATTLICDNQPDRLLYLAPGQQLSRKLGYVQY